MIERAHALSPREFRRTYLRTSTPVILTGIASNWSAAHWTLEQFAVRFPDLVMPYEVWPGDGEDDVFDYDANKATRHARIGDFLALLRDAPGRTFYSTMFRLFDALPQLRGEFESLDAFMRVPRFLQLPPNLWTGPGGTLSVLHFDRVHNLHVQLSGRKKWVLIPPERSSDAYWPCDDLRIEMLQFSPVDAEHPDLSRYPRFSNARPIEFVLEPGEILFLPTSWWHQVRSLEPAMSLNFFWIAPLETTLALRRYFFELARLFMKQKIHKRILPRLHTGR